MARSLPPPLIELLRQTSRSFYLTLRVLPRGVRPQIGLAYLLARTTDTVADTEIIPLEDRLRGLEELHARILGSVGGPLDLGGLARQQGSPAERMLLDKVEDSLAALNDLSAFDRQLVREVLDTITGGQELDLRRFHGASTGNIIPLRTDAELDDYTYRVAGCVGEFWTKMCRAHLFPDAQLDEAQFVADAIRFGKGLQLVNVLRDLPVDLRKGRCYLPLDKLAEANLKPVDLLRPSTAASFQPFYHRYLNLAGSHLAAGWFYTNCMPWGQMRVRLACAWPILIGLETLKRLRVENVLDLEHRVKISRAEVRRLFMKSILAYPWPSAWKKLVNVSRSSEGKRVASDNNLK